MSDPHFTQPWHGIPREQTDWHPVINPDVCNGCGRSVFRYDYDARVPAAEVRILEGLVGEGGFEPPTEAV